MHYYTNYTYLPSIIAPLQNHKKIKSFIINNTLNLTTSQPSLSEIKHYYITKLKSYPTPSDFHSSILSSSLLQLILGVKIGQTRHSMLSKQQTTNTTGCKGLNVPLTLTIINNHKNEPR